MPAQILKCHSSSSGACLACLSCSDPNQPQELRCPPKMRRKSRQPITPSEILRTQEKDLRGQTQKTYPHRTLGLACLCSLAHLDTGYLVQVLVITTVASACFHLYSVADRSGALPMESSTLVAGNLDPVPDPCMGVTSGLTSI